MYVYKRKDNPNIICNIIDRNDRYVIYQYLQNDLVVTNKARLGEFLEEWEILK